MKSIVELVNAASEQVGAVAKKERNTHQGFMFRGIDAVVNAVAGPLRDNGLVGPVPRVPLKAEEIAQVNDMAEALQLGYRLVDRALTTWDHCMTLDEWPGMPQTIQTISAPRWAHYTTEEEEY